jgi:hypothetical protein
MQAHTGPSNQHWLMKLTGNFEYTFSTFSLRNFLPKQKGGEKLRRGREKRIAFCLKFLKESFVKTSTIRSCKYAKFI